MKFKVCKKCGTTYPEKTKKCKYCHIDLDEININIEKIAKRIVKEISGSKQNDKASNSSP